MPFCVNYDKSLRNSFSVAWDKNIPFGHTLVRCETQRTLRIFQRFHLKNQGNLLTLVPGVSATALHWNNFVPGNKKKVSQTLKL